MCVPDVQKPVTELDAIQAQLSQEKILRTQLEMKLAQSQSSLKKS